MLTFDDVDSRVERSHLNPKFFKFEEVFDYIRNKLRNAFSPGQEMSVDESLLSFYGRCCIKKFLKVVLKLAERYAFTYRSITADNFFCSISLAQMLRRIGLYLTGTLRSNKREIPTEFLANRVYKFFGESNFFLIKKNF